MVLGRDHCTAQERLQHVQPLPRSCAGLGASVLPWLLLVGSSHHRTVQGSVPIVSCADLPFFLKLAFRIIAVCTA